MLQQVSVRRTLTAASITQLTSAPVRSVATAEPRLVAIAVAHLTVNLLLLTWQPAISLTQAAPIPLVVDFPMYISNLGLAVQRASNPEQTKSSQSANPMASSFDNNDPDDADDLESTYSPLNSAGLTRSTEADSLALDLDEQIMAASEPQLKSQPQQANSSDNQAQDAKATTIATIVTSKSVTGITNSLIMSSGTNRISNFVRRPNGQLVQFCDETTNLKCDDENAICDLGACVCKPGFFSIRMLGVCQSVSDLMKNCENDYQCQAIYVDLICDTRSHERPFCDCADGLFFDQETHTCLPCQRVPINNKVSPANNGTTNQTATTGEPIDQHRLKPCRAHDLTKYNLGRRRPLGGQAELGTESIRFGNSSNTSGSFTIATQVASNQAASDPLRLKTPFEVFMGAIMLFTLFTVAWFFLQRMIHDCRAILRSLRNPDFAGSAGGLNGACPDQSFAGGPLSNFTVAHHRALGTHHYFDPTGQAVARLFPADSYNPALSSLYQRDLAGVMVQHLTANLSPSSTSHTLVSAHGGTTTRSILGAANEHEAALYPLTASAQQTRHAAAAAAAQLLLSPTHPAIAILRAAAAAQSPGPDYTTSANLLSSMFDPPPKYEEAVAQSNQLSYQSSTSPPTPPPPLSLVSPQGPTHDGEPADMDPTTLSPVDGNSSSPEQLATAPATPTADDMATGQNSPFVESSPQTGDSNTGSPGQNHPQRSVSSDFNQRNNNT